jgi:hypothetical protein
VSEWRVTRIFWERMASSSLLAALDVFKSADSEGREEKTGQILYPLWLSNEETSLAERFDGCPP